jgi:hypothetical protein
MPQLPRALLVKSASEGGGGAADNGVLILQTLQLFSYRLILRVVVEFLQNIS